MGAHPLSFASLDFATTPFLVIWEVTRACGLACQHCRAEAMDTRDPLELTTEEGKELLGQIHELGTPVCVLSGGDPLERSDLAELVRHGKSVGLRMATIPAATPRLTRERLVELVAAGLDQVAFSLDGSTAERHDGFRQVPGTFDRTIEAVGFAHEIGIPLQINTTFAAHNYDDVDRMTELVESLRVVFWEIFSLVPVGRGTVLRPMSAVEHEALFAKLYATSMRAGFIVKVTEAPHYRRYVLAQRDRGGGSRPGGGHPAGGERSGSAIPAQLSRELSTHESFGARAKGINSGKGFCFVSHLGEVFPSGFFPVPVGSIRERPLAELYRDTDLMRALRDPSRLAGRCGRCEYADVCGGSRARAYAVHGDWFAEDPACLYEPPRR
ncbi:MAG: TIGR04053 family radical SAM/SPASM domain-containing protein [Polyangiaceae bacterium]|nr:TIGR04053 family radical SAM/SPASM domain-containing protein [Polyangiaceae bacterium]